MEWVKRRLCHVIIASLVVLVSGCEESKPPLRLGTNIWPGYEPLYMARELGYLAPNQVRLVELLSTSEVIRAYRNGALDAVALTLDEALMLADSGIALQILLVTDASHGADKILARDTDSMKALQGKRIGAETTALGAYMLSRALSLNGMQPGDVQVVPLELNMHEHAFQSGKVDAVVSFEPVATRLQAAGALPVFDSSQIPSEIVDVIAVRPAILKERPEQAQYLIDAWYRSLNYLAREPERAAVLMMPRLGMEAEQVQAALLTLRIPDRAANDQLLEAGGPLGVQIERLSQVMLEQQLIRREVRAEDLIGDRRWLP